MSRERILKLNFCAGNFRQAVELSGRSAGIRGSDACIFQAPGSQEEFFMATSVRKILGEYSSTPFQLDDDAQLANLFAEIDSAGSEAPVVLVRRSGRGPTDLSAKFSIQVDQKRWVGSFEEVLERKTLQFVLPVSQIQTIGEGEYAPLWLVVEKLKQKQSSEWGGKSRQKNQVDSEYVPSQARALSSKRTEALKHWIMEKRAELLRLADEKKEEEIRMLCLAADAVKTSLAQFIEDSSQKAITAHAIKIFRFKLENCLRKDFQLLPGHLVAGIANCAAIELGERYLKPQT